MAARSIWLAAARFASRSYKLLRSGFLVNSRHPRIAVGQLFRGSHLMSDALLCSSDGHDCAPLQNANERCDPVSALQLPA